MTNKAYSYIRFSLKRQLQGGSLREMGDRFRPKHALSGVYRIARAYLPSYTFSYL